MAQYRRNQLIDWLKLANEGRLFEAAELFPIGLIHEIVGPIPLSQLLPQRRPCLLEAVDPVTAKENEKESPTKALL